jgi:hypothetical protein
MVHSILERVRPEEIRMRPFPHVVVRDALPADYYAHLAATYPSLESVAGECEDTGELPSNKAYRLSAADVVASDSIDPAWREFFAYHASPEFFAEVRSQWGALIERIYPNIPADFGKPLSEFQVESRQPGAHRRDDNYQTDITLDCQFAMNSPVRSVSSVRGPHVDRGLKLFAATLYFRLPGDAAPGGDLELYEFRDPRYRFDPDRPMDYHFVRHSPYRELDVVPESWVRVVDRIPYAANVLVFWINTPFSLHGVTPRGITDVPRRYINFVGECFSGPKYGFFVVPPGRPGWQRALKKTKRAAKRLLRRRGSKSEDERDSSRA